MDSFNALRNRAESDMQCIVPPDDDTHEEGEVDDTNVDQHDESGNGKPTPTKRTFNPPSLPTGFNMPSFSFPSSSKISSDNSGCIKMLLVALGIMFLICLILVIVAGVYSKRNPYSSLCTDTDCLSEAYQIMDFMNTDADPCTDFYEYACGGFAKLNPLDDVNERIEFYDVINKNNEKEMKDMLEMPPASSDQTSIDWKLHTFFSSCIDDYSRTSNGAGPLIDQMKKFSKWYALGDDTVSNWTASDMYSTMKTIMTSYGTDPFFSIRLYITSYLGKQREYIIQVGSPSFPLGSYYDYLNNNARTARLRAAYTELITDYFTYVWNDVGAPLDAQERLATIVNDVWDIESQLANLSSHGYIIGPGFQTLDYLDKTYSDIIQWFDLLTSVFHGATLTKQATIKLSQEKYIAGMTQVLKQDTRKINNYIMWKLLYYFRSDLGWKFIHSNRVFYLKKYGLDNANFQGLYNWCFGELEKYVPDALSSFFVRKAWSEVGRAQVNTVYKMMKQQFITRVDSYSFFNPSEKQEAKLKFQNLLDQIGYSPELADVKAMNARFSSLTINDKKHLQNVFALEKWQLSYQTSLLSRKFVTAAWPSSGLYKVSSTYNGYEQRIFVSAGGLEQPLFDIRWPEYINFGSMTAMGGYQLTMVIDDSYGRYMNHTGAPGNWWSKDTITNFATNVAACQTSLYDNKMFRGTNTVIKHPEYFKSKNERYLGAVLAGFQAYQKYVSIFGPDMMLPAFGTDPNQIFFIKFAQSFCYNADQNTTINEFNHGWGYYGIPNDILLNTVLSQSPDFATSFQCSSSTPMVATKTCPTF